MAEYQNIFTRVQVHAEPEMGVPIDDKVWPREGKPGFNYWFGKFGDAQVGPIYIGGLGLGAFLPNRFHQSLVVEGLCECRTSRYGYTRCLGVCLGDMALLSIGVHSSNCYGTLE